MHMRITAAVLAAFLLPATAKDGGQWGHDPATSEWFKSLKSAAGTPCCDYADGVRLEDPEWHENDDGSFEVFARGQWWTMQPGQLVKATNRVGYAILWWPENWPAPSCFLPGARG
jgi:hypothetical protein